MRFRNTGASHFGLFRLKKLSWVELFARGTIDDRTKILRALRNKKSNEYDRKKSIIPPSVKITIKSKFFPVKEGATRWEQFIEINIFWRLFIPGFKKFQK